MRETVGFSLEQLLRVLDVDRLRSLFYSLLHRQDDCVRAGWGTPGAYYEFGVGRGYTLSKFIRALKAFYRHTRRDPLSYPIVGFDTFRGLPPPTGSADRHTVWSAGDFAVNRDEIIAQIRASGIDPTRGKVRLVEGLFDEVLTDALRNELRVTPPSIVTIDVDYYSSTKRVLDWLRPFVPSGTVFFFDDIWYYHGNPRYGELRAIREFNEERAGFLTPLDRYGTLSTLGHVYVFSREEIEFAREPSRGALS